MLKKNVTKNKNAQNNLFEKIRKNQKKIRKNQKKSKKNNQE